MQKGGNRIHALEGLVDQKFADQIDCFIRCTGPEYFVPALALDLRELEFRIGRVHAVDLICARRAQNFDDFDELINTRLAWEDRLSD